MRAMATSSAVDAPAVAWSTNRPRMIGPSNGNTVPSTSAPMRPASAERRGNMWARRSRPGSTGAVFKARRRYDRTHARCPWITRASSGAHHVEAERERDRDLAGVEGAVLEWARQPVRGGEMNGVDAAHGVDASELGSAVEAGLIDRNDVDALPVRASVATKRGEIG